MLVLQQHGAVPWDSGAYHHAAATRGRRSQKEFADRFPVHRRPNDRQTGVEHQQLGEAAYMTYNMKEGPGRVVRNFRLTCTALSACQSIPIQRYLLHDSDGRTTARMHSEYGSVGRPVGVTRHS